MLKIFLRMIVHKEWDKTSTATKIFSHSPPRPTLVSMNSILQIQDMNDENLFLITTTHADYHAKLTRGSLEDLGMIGESK